MAEERVEPPNAPTGWNILRVVSWIVYVLMVIAVGFSGWLALANWPFIHV